MSPIGIDGLPRPLNMLAFDGNSIRSAPIPLVRCFWLSSMPIKTAAIDKIMITSIATANTLMMERMGRRIRLAKMSLFMFERGSGVDCFAVNPRHQGNSPPQTE